MNEAPEVLVIGAGIAGLTCARELTRRQIPTVVLERARGVGGRCATRRILDDQPVDHGAPFLHGMTATFFAALDAMEPAGRIESWPTHVRGSRLACQPDAFRQGRFRVAHEAGVNVFPKLLARGLDVRRGHEVERIAEEGDHLRVFVKTGEALHAPVVVVATHAPAAWTLVSACADGWPGAPEALDEMAAVQTLPVLCVIAAYPCDAGEVPFDVWYPAESPLLHTISHDSAKRPKATHRVLVLHARPGFSTEYKDAAPESWTAELLREAADLLGAWAGKPTWHVAHRWGAGRVRAADTRGRAPWIEAPFGAKLGVIGDTWSHRGGLEGAFESGDAMAEHIAGLQGIRRAV